MKHIALSAALLLLAACGGDSAANGAADGDGTPTTGTPKAQTVAVESAVREVRCGCKIEGIGKCGNYVAVDGEWLEIGNPKDHDLGVMEWCSAKETVNAKAFLDPPFATSPHLLQQLFTWRPARA